MRFAKRLLRETAGQSLVEFALSAMVFFATVFGTIEFGRAVWTYNMVSDLAQEGARWAAVHGTGSLIPADNAAVQAHVRTRILFTSVLTDVSTVTTPSSVGAAGTDVSVQVTTTFTPMTGLIPNAAITLQSTAHMRVLR